MNQIRLMLSNLIYFTLEQLSRQSLSNQKTISNSLRKAHEMLHVSTVIDESILFSEISTQLINILSYFSITSSYIVLKKIILSDKESFRCFLEYDIQHEIQSNMDDGECDDLICLSISLGHYSHLKLIAEQYPDFIAKSLFHNNYRPLILAINTKKLDCIKYLTNLMRKIKPTSLSDVFEKSNLLNILIDNDRDIFMFFLCFEEGFCYALKNNIPAIREFLVFMVINLINTKKKNRHFAITDSFLANAHIRVARTLSVLFRERRHHRYWHPEYVKIESRYNLYIKFLLTMPRVQSGLRAFIQPITEHSCHNNKLNRYY